MEVDERTYERTVGKDQREREFYYAARTLVNSKLPALAGAIDEMNAGVRFSRFHATGLEGAGQKLLVMTL